MQTQFDSIHRGNSAKNRIGLCLEGTSKTHQPLSIPSSYSSISFLQCSNVNVKQEQTKCRRILLTGCLVLRFASTVHLSQGILHHQPGSLRIDLEIQKYWKQECRNTEIEKKKYRACLSILWWNQQDEKMTSASERQKCWQSGKNVGVRADIRDSSAGPVLLKYQIQIPCTMQ